MGSKKKTVQVGVFESADDARIAIRELRGAGFPEDEIGLLTHDHRGNPQVTTFRAPRPREAPRSVRRRGRAVPRCGRSGSPPASCPRSAP